ncbi:hypothetical protein B0T19DRAFT_87042 [Cercophora scortea]|uniref:Uncharacterized protein n=1 Tax=Cercophora scortea TaxID=314031 RepID=A0AAE0IWI1_9PEZI|nr:hypothetical protein B0T19DRAFT_87042 [Cercophora scortea]
MLERVAVDTPGRSEEFPTVFSDCGPLGPLTSHAAGHLKSVTLAVVIPETNLPPIVTDLAGTEAVVSRAVDILLGGQGRGELQLDELKVHLRVDKETHLNSQKWVYLLKAGVNKVTGGMEVRFVDQTVVSKHMHSTRDRRTTTEGLVARPLMRLRGMATRVSISGHVTEKYANELRETIEVGAGKAEEIVPDKVTEVSHARKRRRLRSG